MIILFILGLIPYLGVVFDILYWIIGLLSLALWIALMVMASQEKKYKLPWSGELAEKWAG